tara:strand:+ start:2731 stop:2976 length:246 start_codon:yes stop_codon:yes gene_type:complete
MIHKKKDGGNGIGESKYLDSINIQNRIIQVRKPFKVDGGNSPGIYEAVDIQLLNNNVLVWAFVNKKLTCFNTEEIVGIWQR